MLHGLVTAATALALVAPPAVPPLAPLPSSFVEIAQDRGGGTVWQGRLPGSHAYWPTLVYLPPGFGAVGARYPLVEVLHGLPGSPYSIVDGLGLPETADALVRAHAIRPFVAVIPAAGAKRRYRGEWTGPWEREALAATRWAEAKLPVLPSRGDRVVAGLSAGGYGAVDVGLRHPRLFGTLEAWSGSFRAPRDGSLGGARTAERRAHDPVLLAAREAPLLRRLHTRFFLSAGSTRDRLTAADTRSFADELALLRLPHELHLAPGGHDGRFWRAQLPAALEYALPAQNARTPQSRRGAHE